MIYQVILSPVLLVLLAIIKPIIMAPSVNKIQFISASEFLAKGYDQEPAGMEGAGHRIYFGRLVEPNGHHVGQWQHNPMHKGFWYTADGQTQAGVHFSADNVQVLVYPPGALAWTYRSGNVKNNLPPNLVLLGIDATSGEPLYGCRSFGWEGVHVGVYRTNSTQCQLNRNGKAFYNSEMELLTLTLYGIVMDHVDK